MYPPEARHPFTCSHAGCPNRATRIVSLSTSEAVRGCQDVPPGARVCETHHPRRCTYCGDTVPWYDGSVCDYCDRYRDEGG